MRCLVLLAAIAAPGVAGAQIQNPVIADTSTLASKSDVAAIQAAMPMPATTAPLTDTLGGAIGNDASRYALATHKHPRITDTQIVTTIAGGTFSGTYPAGFFAIPPTVDLSWVNKGALAMTCELTADPTVSGFAGRCNTLSVASILAAGAGVKVHVVTLPTTTAAP